MKTFTLIIRTPDEQIFEGLVKAVTVSTEELGLMQVLPHHASLSGIFTFSPIKVQTAEEDKEEDFIARRGVILVSNETNTMHILTFACEQRKEISYQTVTDYLAFIEARLKEGQDLNQYQITHLKKEKIGLEYTLKNIKQ